MRINIIDDNKINIEDLTNRQLALLKEAIYHLWLNYADYKINADERENMLKEFDRVNTDRIFNLKEDREKIKDDILKRLS